jgi:hypothetical protein
MEDLPQQDREKFMISLSIPYRNFGRTTQELTYEFIDPFERDEDRYDYTGKKIWIHNIIRFMHKVYVTNREFYIVVVNERKDTTVAERVKQLFEAGGGVPLLKSFRSSLIGTFKYDPIVILDEALKPLIKAGKHEEIGEKYGGNVYRVSAGIVYQKISNAIF